MLHCDDPGSLNCASPFNSCFKKTIQGFMSSHTLQSTAKSLKKLAFIAQVHLEFSFVERKNKTKPPTLKIVIKKWNFWLQLQPFRTEYEVSGDGPKKRAKKPILYSKSIRCPVSHSTITIDLFLGNILSYQVDILNCPRKFAALLQLKIAVTCEAE